MAIVGQYLLGSDFKEFESPGFLPGGGGGFCPPLNVVPVFVNKLYFQQNRHISSQLSGSSSEHSQLFRVISPEKTTNEQGERFCETLPAPFLSI